MRAVSGILGVIALVVGILLIFFAYNATTILSRAQTVSAVQVTQVYSEATFYGVMAIAAFLFAILVMLGAVMASIGEQIEVTQELLHKQ